ncbi:MAG: hypothetical protein ACYDBJ_07085 [Aggregatilineales bacterium]
MNKRLRVPEPEYVEERVDGTLTTRVEGMDCALYVGIDPPPDARIVIQGALVIRYAIPLIVPSTDAIIPGLFISERGGMLTGHECWDYLQTRFQMHPRADVIGLNLNRLRAQALVRELDFGATVRVLAYADPPTVMPLTEVKTLYTTDAMAARLPELLKRYLPRG